MRGQVEIGGGREEDQEIGEESGGGRKGEMERQSLGELVSGS